MDRLRAATTTTSVERQISPGEPAHAAFVRSVEVTDAIMGKVRDRAGSVPIVSFIVDASGYEEYEAAFTQIASRHGIAVLPDIERVLDSYEGPSTVFTSDGSHWNDNGHRLIGHALAESLRKACLLNLCSGTDGLRQN
jgi:hypothetical protein